MKEFTLLDDYRRFRYILSHNKGITALRLFGKWLVDPMGFTDMYWKELEFQTDLNNFYKEGDKNNGMEN